LKHIDGGAELNIRSSDHKPVCNVFSFSISQSPPTFMLPLRQRATGGNELRDFDPLNHNLHALVIKTLTVGRLILPEVKKARNMNALIQATGKNKRKSLRVSSMLSADSADVVNLRLSFSSPVFPKLAKTESTVKAADPEWPEYEVEPLILQSNNMERVAREIVTLECTGITKTNVGSEVKLGVGRFCLGSLFDEMRECLSEWKELSVPIYNNGLLSGTVYLSARVVHQKELDALIPKDSYQQPRMSLSTRAAAVSVAARPQQNLQETVQELLSRMELLEQRITEQDTEIKRLQTVSNIQSNRIRMMVNKLPGLGDVKMFEEEEDQIFGGEYVSAPPPDETPEPDDDDN
jgi:hypothetical protein